MWKGRSFDPLKAIPGSSSLLDRKSQTQKPTCKKVSVLRLRKQFLSSPAPLNHLQSFLLLELTGILEEGENSQIWERVYKESRSFLGKPFTLQKIHHFLREYSIQLCPSNTFAPNNWLWRAIHFSLTFFPSSKENPEWIMIVVLIQNQYYPCTIYKTVTQLTSFWKHDPHHKSSGKWK